MAFIYILSYIPPNVIQNGMNVSYFFFYGAMLHTSGLMAGPLLVPILIFFVAGCTCDGIALHREIVISKI